jgi:hypothetical protein
LIDSKHIGIFVEQPLQARNGLSRLLPPEREQGKGKMQPKW